MFSDGAADLPLGGEIAVAPCQDGAVGTPLQDGVVAATYEDGVVAAPFGGGGVAAPFGGVGVAAPFLDGAHGVPFRDGGVAAPSQDEAVGSRFQDGVVVAPFEDEAEPPVGIAAVVLLLAGQWAQVFPAPPQSSCVDVAPQADGWTTLCLEKAPVVELQALVGPCVWLHQGHHESPQSRRGSRET